MLVGYMRVSTVEQNLALQRDALEGVGCERLYEDICSGAVIERPGLTKALDHIPSSTLYHYLHADGSLKEPGRKLLDR